MIVCTRDAATELGLKPVARLLSCAAAGVDPEVMGWGPVPASRIALKRAGLELSDIDLVELNEAFAAQSLAVGRELDWDWERVNVQGGAIAMGHAVGASGARIATTLLHKMQREQARLGIAALCIGGGMGIGMLFERAG